MSELIKYGKVSINPKMYSVFINGKEKSLTKTQYRLIEVLVKNGGAVVGTEKLIEEAFPFTECNLSNLRAHISILKKTIGNNIILTKGGFGYYISDK